MCAYICTCVYTDQISPVLCFTSFFYVYTIIVHRQLTFVYDSLLAHNQSTLTGQTSPGQNPYKIFEASEEFEKELTEDDKLLKSSDYVLLLGPGLLVSKDSLQSSKLSKVNDVSQRERKARNTFSFAHAYRVL